MFKSRRFNKSTKRNLIFVKKIIKDLNRIQIKRHKMAIVVKKSNSSERKKIKRSKVIFERNKVNRKE